MRFTYFLLLLLTGLKKTVEEVKNAVTTITNLLEPIQDAVADLRRVADIVSNELRRAQSVSLIQSLPAAVLIIVISLRSMAHCGSDVNSLLIWRNNKSLMVWLRLIF